MFFEKFSQVILLLTGFIVVLSILKLSNGLCIFGEKISCLTELSDDETNSTMEYVLDKYEQLDMKIMGQLKSVYGLRLTYSHKKNSESKEERTDENEENDGNDDMEIEEEDVNIHFKYIDNTPHDIIQNCVFVINSNVKDDCKRIQTICNTFLPITPRPLMQRDNLRVCNDNDVQIDIQNDEMDVTSDNDVDDETATELFRTGDNLTVIETRYTADMV